MSTEENFAAYRRIAGERIDALRKELEEQAVCNGAGASREAALRATIAELQKENAALRAAAVEVCAIARVWATVWHDKLSLESIRRFTELEQKILRRDVGAPSGT